MTAAAVVEPGTGCERSTPRARRVVAAFAWIWAAIGLGIAGAGLLNVNADAIWLVGAAAVVFPAAAVGAAFAAKADRLRLAGALLVISVGTPTFYVYVVNLVALVVGVVLLAGAFSRRGHRLAPPP